MSAKDSRLPATLFKASFARVLGSNLPVLGVFLLSGVATWVLTQKVSVLATLSILVPAFAFMQTRRTFVEVGEHRLRIQSHASLGREPVEMSWTEITDAVPLERWWPFSTKIEVRAGVRFAWIHLGVLADRSRFIEEVQVRSGATSPLSRTLSSIGPR